MLARKSRFGPAGPVGIRLLSATSGRERWEVRVIHRRPRAAQQLEAELMLHANILSVTANHVTGRALILYRPNAENPSVVAHLVEFSERARRYRVTREPVVSSRSALSQILKESLPRGRGLAMPIVLSIVGQLVYMLRGLSFVAIVNTARGEGPRFPNALGIVKTGPRLIFMTGLSLFLTAASTWLQHRRRLAWRALAQRTQHHLRSELIEKIESQDMAFFNEYGTGHLLNLVIEDTTRIGEFIEKAGDDIIVKSLTIVIAGTFLILASPVLALLAALPLPFMLLFSRVFGGTTSERYARVGEISNHLSEMLENNFVGIADVKSFTAEAEEVRRLRDCDLVLSESAESAGSMSSTQSAFAGGAFSLGYIVTAGYGGLMVTQRRISVSDYMRVFFWFPLLLEALTNIERIAQHYYRASNAAKQLVEVLETKPTIVSGRLRLPKGKVQGAISFEGITFGYEPSIKVLQDISFEVRPSETVAIVGPTGSGKSTLLRLLMRFFEADSGRIFLDGTDIRELDLVDLRGTVSLVSQDVHLFPGTVRDNLLLGQRGVVEEELLHALRDARADKLLETLPNGLDTSVGERGQRLSGGERQRVAVARALLKLRRGAAILALDEATSHLDNKSEADFKRNLGKASTGKSVIMIAHRLSTVRTADRVLVLHKGQLVEEGNHEQLLARKGLYASLWQLQTGKDSSGDLEVRLIGQ